MLFFLAVHQKQSCFSDSDDTGKLLPGCLKHGAGGFYYWAGEFCSQLALWAGKVFWGIHIAEEL